MRLAVATLVAVACAPSAREVKLQKSSTYDTSFDAVWDGVLGALATEYPTASLLDKEHHRIVSCWRPIEKPSMGGTLLYRVSVDISMEAPWRVSVSGRAGMFQPPQIIPIRRDDAEEPGWVEGRTDRVHVNIYKALGGSALAAVGDATPSVDPTDPVNISEACVIRSDEFWIPARGEGLALDPDGDGLTDPGRQALPTPRVINAR